MALLLCKHVKAPEDGTLTLPAYRDGTLQTHGAGTLLLYKQTVLVLY